VSWDRIASSYDDVAAAYEARFVDELSGKPRDRELLDAFAAAVGDPVLDVGCGPGQIGAHLRSFGRTVHGVDLSPAMAQLAATRLDGAAVVDMRMLPFADACIGGVVAFYSLIHLRREEVAFALREFARVLRPRGRVLLSAHEGEGDVEVHEMAGRSVAMSATFFTLDELVAAAIGAGLVVTVADRRPPYDNEGTTIRLYVEAQRPA
jgi:SAM-dependent methyltransferase